MQRKTILDCYLLLHKFQPKYYKNNKKVWELFFGLTAINLLIPTFTIHFCKNPLFRPWSAIVNLYPTFSCSSQCKIIFIKLFTQCHLLFHFFNIVICITLAYKSLSICAAANLPLAFVLMGNALNHAYESGKASHYSM